MLHRKRIESILKSKTIPWTKQTILDLIAPRFRITLERNRLKKDQTDPELKETNKLLLHFLLQQHRNGSIHTRSTDTSLNPTYYTLYSKYTIL